ncbi:DUF3100 domain-containing protein, partial [Listeria welshimeri]|nr:DUF3100 domain-containing protein [Listeria welshimeri]
MKKGFIYLIAAVLIIITISELIGIKTLQFGSVTVTVL